MASTLWTALATIGKVHRGYRQVGWIEPASPIPDALRAHVKTCHDGGDLRQTARALGSPSAGRTACG